MPKGDLLDFIKAEVNGLIYQSTVSDEVKLGGRSYPRTYKHLIEIDEQCLSETYLTVVATLNEPPTKVSWKVSIEGLSIIREFKPQITAETSSGSIYAVHVFDLSKIIKGGRTYELMISCDSSKPIIINGFELIGVKPLSGVSTETYYKAGCVLINPSETYVSKFNVMSSGTYNLSLLMNLPSRNSTVDITLNNTHIKTLNNLLGLNNIHLTNLHVGSDNVLAIHYRESSELYHPRYVAIFSILKYKLSCNGPEISLSADEVTCNGDFCKIMISIKNEGDIPCDNLVITGFSAGAILVRDVIPILKPHEVIQRCYSLKNVNQAVTFKAVYKKFGRQCINELKVIRP
jgi:hypothetical protein